MGLVPSNTSELGSCCCPGGTACLVCDLGWDYLTPWFGVGTADYFCKTTYKKNLCAVADLSALSVSDAVLSAGTMAGREHTDGGVYFYGYTVVHTRRPNETDGGFFGPCVGPPGIFELEITVRCNANWDGGPDPTVPPGSPTPADFPADALVARVTVYPSFGFGSVYPYERSVYALVTHDAAFESMSFDFDIPADPGYDPAAFPFLGHVGGHVTVSRVPCPDAAGAVLPGEGVNQWQEAAERATDTWAWVNNNVLVGLVLPDCLRHYGGHTDDDPAFDCVLFPPLVWDGAQAAWVAWTNTGRIGCSCDDQSSDATRQTASTVLVKLTGAGTITLEFYAPDNTLVCSAAGAVTVASPTSGTFSVTCSSGTCAGSTITGTVGTIAVSSGWCFSGVQVTTAAPGGGTQTGYAAPVQLVQVGVSSFWTASTAVLLDLGGGPAWHTVGVGYDAASRVLTVVIADLAPCQTSFFGGAGTPYGIAGPDGWGAGYDWAGAGPSADGCATVFGPCSVTSCPIFS